MLIELISKYTNEPIAIDHELIGEVKDVAKVGQPRYTLIIHRKNRRVHWSVVERYEQVMAAIRKAETPKAESRNDSGCGASDGDVQLARVQGNGHGADLAGQATVPEALA